MPIQKAIEAFVQKINDRALETALRHSFGGSKGQAQTQAIFKSAAVAAGSNRLALERSTAILAILTQLENQKRC